MKGCRIPDLYGRQNYVEVARGQGAGAPSARRTQVYLLTRTFSKKPGEIGIVASPAGLLRRLARKCIAAHLSDPKLKLDEDDLERLKAVIDEASATTKSTRSRK